MESENLLKPGAERYRGITEKSKGLLFLLREAPYITMADAKRFHYPTHKTLSYTREMFRVLLKNKLVSRYMLGNGVFIYYLTDPGRRLTEFFLEAKPKFDPEFRSFYYTHKPTKPSEASDFFIFPTRGLEFHSFTPHFLHAHPFLHTRALLELSVLFRQSFRFFNVLWMDEIKAKKMALNIDCHPDLLLCNDFTTETGRVYVELENSRIRELDLLEKIHHLTVHPADWYLFLATSEEILLNLGRLVRKILTGEAKVNHHPLYFSARAQSALHKNVLFGLWEPSFKTDKPPTKIKEIDLFRYDDEIFDKRIWVPDVSKSPLQSEEPRAAHWQVVGYSGRRMGKRKWKLGEILDTYTNAFRLALDKTMA